MNAVPDGAAHKADLFRIDDQRLPVETAGIIIERADVDSEHTVEIDAGDQRGIKRLYAFHDDHIFLGWRKHSRSGQTAAGIEIVLGDGDFIAVQIRRHVRFETLDVERFDAFEIEVHLVLGHAAGFDRLLDQIVTILIIVVQRYDGAVVPVERQFFRQQI